MELIQQFDLLASSLGGVAKLRELILSLAVRGKLVPQDPADEPASVLLQKIRAEKECLIAEGKIKKDKPLPEIYESEKKYELPSSWSWARLGGLLSRLSNGYTDKQSKDKTAFPVTRIETISKSTVDIHKVGYCENISPDDVEKYRLMAGDILFSHINSGLHIGKTAVFDGVEFLLHGTNLLLLRPSTLVNPSFLNIAINNLRLNGYFLGVAQHAIGQASINQSKLSFVLIPIPPLTEQSRIVAKVDELMALCDRLEAEQGQAARVQGHCVEAALAQLADSADADEFARHWQHLALHFDTLFTTPDSITQLEATLLQLAVRGKLVPQDPSDEPASTLLQKIRTEKDRLIAEGKIKKDKPLPPISDEEKPFALPEGWKWVQWGDLTKWVTYGFTRPMPHLDHGMPIVTAKNVQYGWMDLENVHFTSAEAYFSLSPKDKPRRGDILITKDGSIGRAAHVQTDTEFCINQSVAVLWMAGLPLNRDYLILVAHAPFMQERIWAAAEGAAIKHISITEFVRFALPLPPLAEQSRIVAKLESLFALTAGLKAQLAKAQQAQALLADVLLETSI